MAAKSQKRTLILGIGANNPRINGFTSTGTGVFTSAATNGLQLYNTADQTTNYERLEALWSSNVALIQTTRAGSGSGRNFRLKASGSSGGSFIELSRLAAPFFNAYFEVDTGAVGDLFRFGSGAHTSTATSGTTNVLAIKTTYNQAASTATNTDLLIQRTETAVGSGTQNLIQAGTAASTSLFTVSNAGAVTSALGFAEGSGTLGNNRLVSLVGSRAGERYGEIVNTSTSTAAHAYWQVTQASDSGNNGLRMRVNSTGFTTAGLQLQDGSNILSGSGLSAGLVVGTQAAAPLIFATNDAEVGRFLSVGTLQLLTSATTAGLYVRINGATVGPLS